MYVARQSAQVFGRRHPVRLVGIQSLGRGVSGLRHPSFDNSCPTTQTRGWARLRAFSWPKVSISLTLINSDKNIARRQCAMLYIQSAR